MNNNRKCFGLCKETERLEKEIERLENELEIYKKAYELACKAIQEAKEPDFCNSYSDDPCRKGNIFGKAWDDNKCVECCKEHFITQARKRGS